MFQNLKDQIACVTFTMQKNVTSTLAVMAIFYPSSPPSLCNPPIHPPEFQADLHHWVDRLLKDTRDAVVRRIQTCKLGGHISGEMNSGVFLRSSVTCSVTCKEYLIAAVGGKSGNWRWKAESGSNCHSLACRCTEPAGSTMPLISLELSDTKSWNFTYI